MNLSYKQKFFFMIKKSERKIKKTKNFDFKK